LKGIPENEEQVTAF
jgi:hypothetical protein